MKTKKVEKVEDKTREICQYCRYHENHPSVCVMVKGEITHVPRKSKCEFFDKI